MEFEVMDKILSEKSVIIAFKVKIIASELRTEQISWSPRRCIIIIIFGGA